MGKRYPTGVFQTQSGKVPGTHSGIIRYTVGQRKRLGITWKKPLYVCEIRTENNTVILGPREELFSKAAFISNFHWISNNRSNFLFRCLAKKRARQPEQPFTIDSQETGDV